MREMKQRMKTDTKWVRLRKFTMVCSPTGRVDKTACDTRDKQLVGNLELNDMVEVFFA